MRKGLLLSICLISCIFAFANEPAKRPFSLSVHGGYATMLHSSAAGLTNSSPSYTNNFHSGPSWDAQFDFKFKFFSTGLLYSGYTAKGALAESSDHIYTHYLAPQFAIHFLRTDKFDIKAGPGVGYIWYRNNSMVYGKERRVTGGNIATNIGLNGVWFLSRELGLSLDVQYIDSSLFRVNVDYHGETVKVRFPLKDPLPLERINISLGLSYFF
jgi:hypothetical protein